MTLVLVSLVEDALEVALLRLEIVEALLKHLGVLGDQGLPVLVFALEALDLELVVPLEALVLVSCRLEQGLQRIYFILLRANFLLAWLHRDRHLTTLVESALVESALVESTLVKSS